MILLSPIVYRFCLKNTLLPNFYLLALLLAYFIFLSRSTMYRSFMNGVGKISLQLYITGVQAIIHVPLAILLGKYVGILGVVISMASWQLINSIWEKIQFKRIINKTATGIWDK
jgi:O-antigen/teichoic acid export membrane protein